MSTYGSHPGEMTVKLTLGDGAHLVATSENGWAGPVTLRWGPTDGEWGESTTTLSDPGTVDGTEVSWTLTAEQVAARAEFGWVRLIDNGMTMQAGRVLVWSGGLGSTTTQTIASLTAGPPGPTAVSADPDNVATLGSDGLIYVPESVGGGGDTTVQIGTVTLPESPSVGLSVSVLADSTTDLPEGVTWDSGGEPTITERMLLVFVWSGDDWVGTYGLSIPGVPVAPDVTGPTAGTLGVVVGVTSADGTVTGAEDETELDAAPYSFRIDAGTYSAWQAGNTYEWTGLDPDTEYDFQHRARDAAGNITEGAVVTDSTDPVPPDVTPPTPGTLAASAITSDSFTLTVSGASDDEALHGTPYRFSTDNGVSYSAYQTSAVYEATGLDPETEYTCVHQVRDAALNVATGAAITVTTDAAPPSALAAAILALSPEGYWKLDETSGTTATDSSGNGHHGTYEGAVTLNSTKGAPAFAAASRVLIPDHDNFTFWTSSESTFFAVFRKTAISNGTLVSKITGSTLAEWTFEYSGVEGGTVAGRRGGDSIATYGRGEIGGAINSGTWYAAACALPVNSGTPSVRGELYLNSGTAVTSAFSTVSNAPTGNSTSPVVIGSRTDGTLQAVGNICHVAVFRSRLTAGQVGGLMAAAVSDGLI